MTEFRTGFGFQVWEELAWVCLKQGAENGTQWFAEGVDFSLVRAGVGTGTQVASWIGLRLALRL